MAPCPTNFGRANRLGGPIKMMTFLKENTITAAQAKKMKPEELEGKTLRGIFVNRETVSYLERYDALCRSAKEPEEGTE